MCLGYWANKSYKLINTYLKTNEFVKESIEKLNGSLREPKKYKDFNHHERRNEFMKIK